MPDQGTQAAGRDSPGRTVATCDFCKIVRGTSPARVVYDNGPVTAFFPDSPVALGHTLVVPKEHVADILAADPVVASDVMLAARHVGRAIQRAVQPDGVSIITSVGEAASQTVFHLHVHIVPRWLGDSMGDIWPPSPPWTVDEQDRTAGLIRSAAQEPQ